MASVIQDQGEVMTLLETTPSAPTSIAPRRAWGRKVAVCAASLCGAAGLAAWSSQATLAKDSSVPGPAKVADVQKLHQENMEAFENFRMLLDPDASIPTIPTPDPKSMIDSEDLWDYQCFLDFYQSSGYFSQGVNALMKMEWYAGQSCDDDRSATSGCVIYIEVAISLWLWMAQYFCLAASSCTHTTNVEAGCAADITGLLADLLEIVYLGQSLAVDCDFQSTSLLPDLPKPLQDRLDSLMENRTKRHPHPHPHHGKPDSSQKFLKGPMEDKSPRAVLGRRLAAGGAGNLADKIDALGSKLIKQREARTGKKLEEEDNATMPQQLKEMVTTWKEKKEEMMTKRVRIVSCFFDIWGALGTFMRGTKTMLGTIANGCDDPEVCAIGIIFNFGSWCWTAQAGCAAASDCNLQYNQKAACTADNFELAGSIADLIGYLMVIPTDCKAKDVPVLEVVEIQEEGHRRLADDMKDEEEEEEEEEEE